MSQYRNFPFIALALVKKKMSPVEILYLKLAHT
jgi:hypothetical protein